MSSPQASSHKLLVSLYRKVLLRNVRACRRGDTAAKLVHGQLCLHLHWRQFVTISKARIVQLSKALLRTLRRRIGLLPDDLRILWQVVVHGPEDGVSPRGTVLPLRILVEALQPRVFWSVTPLGSDLLANVIVTNKEVTPDIAVAADGSFVVVWQSDGNRDGDKDGIIGRRFAADGTALGGEFIVNTVLTGSQTDPSIAMDDAGNFAVAWVDDQGVGDDIYVRLFDSSGTAITSNVAVNTYVNGNQTNPSIGMNGSGAFVVTWEGEGVDDNSGVWGQQFTSAGALSGGQFRVNAVTSSSQYEASVSVASDGSFVVTHTDDSGGRYIAAQRFTAGGVGQGQFAVDFGDVTSGNGQDISAVASADNGDFIVAWSGSGASSRIAVRQFDLNGVAKGATFRAAPAAVKSQVSPSVSADNNGNFIVVWQDDVIDGNGKGIGGAAFNTDGSRNSGVFQVNQFAAKDQELPAVAVNDSGRAVVVWGKEQSGDNDGVAALRFDLGAPVTPNQAPVNAVPASQSTTEDNALVFAAASLNAISISDSDAAGNFVEVSLNVDGGSLTLGATNGLNFTIGDGVGDSSITFSGSLSAINLALEGLTFSTPPDETGTYTLTITTNDLGNTGTGGALTDIDTVSITVTPINDAPVNTVPAAQTTSEDTPLVFSGANGNAISVTDVDATTVEVSLGVSQGTLTLSSTAGLTFTAGDGDADVLMTFSGTATAVNAAINGLGYTPGLDFNGADTLTITTSDLGNTGAGGSQADTDTVGITVTAVNDAPVNSLPPGQSIDPGTPLINNGGDGDPGGIGWSPVPFTVSLADVDLGGSEAQLTLSASVGRLNLASTTGLTFLSGNGISDTSMTFRGTLAALNAATNGMTYEPPTYFSGTATISVTSSDLGNTGAGGAKTDSDVISVGIAYVNTAPQHTVPSGQSMVEDGSLVFSSAFGTRITVSDGTAGSADVMVTLAANEGRMTLNGTAGLSFVTGDGSNDATMTFTGTLTNINNAINGLTFNAGADYFGPASITITTDDQGNSGTGGALTDTDVISVAVTPVNDPPVNQLPATQTTAEDVGLVFSTANGNRVAFDDVDAGSGPIRVAIGASNGLVWLGTAAGITFVSGDGVADSTTIIEGTPAALNAALDGMRFEPSADFVGTATLTLDTDDLGFFGAGSVQTDSDAMSISVVAVNDAPIGSGLNLQLTEDGANATVDLHDLFDDVDNIDSALLYAISGMTNASVFTSATINPSTGILTLDLAPDAFGTGTVTIQATDPDDLSGFATISVEILPVSDSPVIVTSAATLFFVENDPWTAIDSNLSLLDVDGEPLTGARVTIVGYVMGEDVVGFSGTANITGTWDEARGIMVLSGSASVAEYTAALRTIAYQNLSDHPSTAPRTVVFEVDDAAMTSQPATRSVSVSAVNDPARVVFSSHDSAADDLTAVPVDPDLEVVDPDDDYLTSAQVRIEDVVISQDTLEAALPAGLSGVYDSATGTLTITGRASRAEYAAALRSITYANSNQDRDASERTISATIADSTEAAGPRSTRRVRLAAFNAPPVTTAPDKQQTDADLPLIFSAATGNGIAIADADSRSGIVRVMLKAKRGTLTLSHTDGMAFTLGDGVSDVVMEFSGTLPVVNAALEKLTFNPTLNYSGPASIQLIITDVGSPAGERIANRTIPLEVRPVSTEVPVAPPTPAPIVPPSPPEAAADASDSTAKPDGKTQGAPSQHVVRPPPANAFRTGNAPKKEIELSRHIDSREPQVRSERNTGSIESDEATYLTSETDSGDVNSTITSRGVSGPKSGIATGSISGTPLSAAIDGLSESLKDESVNQAVAGTASFVSIGLSVGYFFWVVRAGSVLTSLLSSVPAWKAVDPLPILDDEEQLYDDDDESLQDLVHTNRRKAA